MEKHGQMVDVEQARSFIEANWPNDPLLRQIALNLLEKLPKVDGMAPKAGDLISREALLNTLLDHFGVDLAYMGEDLQFCQEAVQFAPAASEAPLLYGYRLKDLAVIADLMKSQSIDPGKLGVIVGDIGMLYSIAISYHQCVVKEELGKITAEIHYPGVGVAMELVEQMKRNDHGH